MSVLVTAIIITIAFFSESIFGFGGGLISIPLLSLILGVKDSVTVILIFQLLMGFLIFKTHKDTDWKIAIPMTVGLVIGTLLGTYSLSLVDDVFLRRFLAVSIMAFLLKMTIFKGFNFGKHKQTSWGVVAGLVGGWFQGMIGTGGPVFTMYMAVALPRKAAFRATLIYLFFATSVVRVLVSIQTGLLNKRVFDLAWPAVIPFLIAIFVGQRVHHKIDDKYYRMAVWIILFFAAVTMLLKR